MVGGEVEEGSIWRRTSYGSFSLRLPEVVGNPVLGELQRQVWIVGRQDCFRFADDPGTRRRTGRKDVSCPWQFSDSADRILLTGDEPSPIVANECPSPSAPPSPLSSSRLWPWVATTESSPSARGRNWTVPKKAGHS